MNDMQYTGEGTKAEEKTGNISNWSQPHGFLCERPALEHPIIPTGRYPGPHMKGYAQKTHIIFARSICLSCQSPRDFFISSSKKDVCSSDAFSGTCVLTDALPVVFCWLPLRLSIRFQRHQSKELGGWRFPCWRWIWMLLLEMDFNVPIREGSWCSHYRRILMISLQINLDASIRDGSGSSH